jgi:hypothetical protein
MVAVRAAPEPHPEVMREPQQSGRQAQNWLGAWRVFGILQAVAVGAKQRTKLIAPQARGAEFWSAGLMSSWMAAAETTSALRRR